MKKAIVLILMCTFYAQLQAQKVIERDSQIVLIEGKDQLPIDSAKIERKINQVKAEVAKYEAVILQIDAKRGEVMEEKSKAQQTLTYFLEIKNNYWSLIRKLKYKKK